MTRDMKIIAFLQNMWVRDPEKVRRSLEREEDLEIRAEHRLRYIEYALFAGCLTGRRLEALRGDCLGGSEPNHRG